jgi:hypothetical protein
VRRRAGGDLWPGSADEFGQASAAFAGMLEYLRRAAAYLRQIAAGDLSRSFPLASDADELGSDVRPACRGGRQPDPAPLPGAVVRRARPS